jgi:hypothetical protein
MSDKGENQIIRFPRKAREYLGFSNNQVVIGKGEYEVSLTAKKAYKEDIQRLARMLRTGKLTDEEAVSVGFVTRSIQQRVTRKSGKDIWVSKGIGNITIGCDPEFGLIGSGGILHRGTRVLPNSTYHKFGADGPGVEVRPEPTRSHLSLVNNIHEILAQPPGAADDYDWIGGATFKDPHRVYWFGGHIHLGRPNSLHPDVAHVCYQKIATVLDSLLALPLVRLDTPEPYLRRNGCQFNYGKAGDIRADYPEQDRFEYRVLSGLWLTHPSLAKIVLGLSKCIAETAYNKAGEAGFDPDWIKAPASRKGLLKSFGVKGLMEAQRIINTARPEAVKPAHVEEWEKRLRELDYYDNYSEEITALIEIVKQPPKNLKLDIRNNWYNCPPLPTNSSRIRNAIEAVDTK